MTLQAYDSGFNINNWDTINWAKLLLNIYIYIYIWFSAAKTLYQWLHYYLFKLVHNSLLSIGKPHLLLPREAETTRVPLIGRISLLLFPHPLHLQPLLGQPFVLRRRILLMRFKPGISLWYHKVHQTMAQIPENPRRTCLAEWKKVPGYTTNWFLGFQGWPGNDINQQERQTEPAKPKAE